MKDRNYHKITVIFFLAAILIHGMGYFTNYFYVVGWLIWIPAIVLLVIAVLEMKRDGYVINPYVDKKKIYLSTEFIITMLLTIYVIGNAIWCCYLLRNGGGEYKDGIYYLINLGERVREITAEEYGILLLAEYRLFTGHILLVYALEALFFRIKKMEEEA